MKIPYSYSLVAVLAAFAGIGVWFLSEKETSPDSDLLTRPQAVATVATGPVPAGDPPIVQTVEGAGSGSAVSTGSQARAWRHLQKLLAGKQGVDVNGLFDAEEFRIHAAAEEGTFAGENPRQEFGVTFRGDGAIGLDSRRSAKWDWSMRTVGTDEAAWEPVSATRMQRRIAPGECHELGAGNPVDITGALLANRYE